MKLVDLLSDAGIRLDLSADDKNALLRDLVELLGLEADAEDSLWALLKRRETLGSTGIGERVAIPHCRSGVVDRLRVVYGRHPRGVDFEAIDDQPVHHFFLIVAPPVEVSNLYLSVLGQIARFCKSPPNLARLDTVKSREELLDLLEQAPA